MEIKNPPFTRLPIRHFLDFTPDGPLCHILSTMYQFKNEQGWRRFDLSSPSRKDANLQMCIQVQEDLIEQELYKVPVVMIKDNLKEKEKNKVRDIVEKRGG